MNLIGINELVHRFFKDNNIEFQMFNVVNGIEYSFSSNLITSEQIKNLQTHFKRYSINFNLYEDKTKDVYLLKVAGNIKPARKFMFNKGSIPFHMVLFVLTFFTMMAAGAYLQGRLFWEGWEELLTGLSYAICLIAILSAHEFGHYFAATYYGVKATLPYFIFFWAPFFNFGTLGAYIKIKSPIPDKRALLNIGIFGPVAGFIVTLAVLSVGYLNLPDAEGIRRYYEAIHALGGQSESMVNMILGKSLLMIFINDILAEGRLPMDELYHFPVIFAGWTGLFVTALNLMPIGQLDGGHISYSIFGKKAVFISILTFGLLIMLIFISLNYLIWAILIFFIVKFRHPPTLNDSIRLSWQQKLWGIVGYLIFIVSFIPVPLIISY